MINWLSVLAVTVVTGICCLIVTKITGKERKVHFAGTFALISAGGFAYALSEMIQRGLSGGYLAGSILISLTIPVLIFFVLYRSVHEAGEKRKKRVSKGKLEQETNWKEQLEKQLQEAAAESNSLKEQIKKQRSRIRGNAQAAAEREEKLRANIARIQKESQEETERVKREYIEEQARWLKEREEEQKANKERLRREEERLRKEREAAAEEERQRKERLRREEERLRKEREAAEEEERQRKERLRREEERLREEREAEEERQRKEREAAEEAERQRREKEMKLEEIRIRTEQQFAFANIVKKAETFRKKGMYPLAVTLYQQGIEKAETEEEKRKMRKLLADCYIDAGEPGKARKVLAEG